jgi:hypothetical protein
MVIKKESVCKKTGEKKIHYESDKEGYKVLKKKGVPIEVKMTPEERRNRDHGSETNGKGAVGSSNKQSGITRVNKEAETVYKQKQTSQLGESKNELQIKQKKVEDLALRLKKAKVDFNFAVLDKKINDFEQKEKFYKKAAEMFKNDIKKVKDNNLFFVRGEKVNNPQKMEGDIIDRIQQTIGEPQVKENDELKKEQVSESKNIVAKLDKVKELDSLVYNGKNKSYIKGDVLSKISKRLEEADDEDVDTEEGDDKDKEEDAELDKLDDGDEGGDEEDVDAEEEEEENPDEIPVQDNEIQRITKANEYNVDHNNVYEFYDFILGRLSDPTAIEAMNAEYNDIPKEKRKVTSARELFDRVAKRLNMMNKSEADSLNAELSGEGGDEGDEGEELSI